VGDMLDVGTGQIGHALPVNVPGAEGPAVRHAAKGTKVERGAVKASEALRAS
jgi:hypothetical protein